MIEQVLFVDLDSLLKKIKKFKSLGLVTFLKGRKNIFFNPKMQNDLDRKLVLSLSKSKIPNWRQLKYVGKYLSVKERWIIRVSLIVIFLSVSFSATKFYLNNLEIVPVREGVYTEALVGAPKHINPLYSVINDVDNDIAKLVFSSLFKRGKNGELVNDLTESYEISEDSKTYTFTILSDVKWHSGYPMIDDTFLTADDIVYTFNTIKDKRYKSPLRSAFIGVDIEKIDDKRIKFVLSSPYAAFLELLTFGILPSKLWGEIAPESFELVDFQKKPIGSGPYKFKDFSVDTTLGTIKRYNLEINEDYYGKVPLVDISFIFYSDFVGAVEALNSNAVNGVSYLPQNLRENLITPKTLNFYKLHLPQLTVLFFNQESNPALADKAARQALAFSIDKGKMVNEILQGEANIIDSPILPTSFAYNSNVSKYEYNKEEAAKLLESIDWKLTEITEEDILNSEQDKESEDEDEKKTAEDILNIGVGKWRKKDNKFFVINLKTVDRNENSKIVEEIKKDWEAVGVKTIVESLPVSQIQTDVIRPRNFDALFYGQAVGADPDPYAFWHSSQIGADGFNIANFNNKEVDELLEDARVISDMTQRQEKYNKFQEIITENIPAVFMYSPTYTYVQSNNLKGFEVNYVLYPSNRFANVDEWYLKTGKKLIWK